MSDIDRRKEMIAAAAVAMAQRNVTIATARFGYVPPERPATGQVAAMPAASPVKASNDALVSEAARRRAERKAAQAAEAKASWNRVVTKINARNGKSPAESRATRSGWAAVIAAFPSRRG
ncbi:hypothetical protein [Shinella sp.]|uniref:hypothetical protein n=1 Tax=Shinella sp. TaxID=1870904 RepID=UPI003F727D59